jgi:hypothetical protein
MVRTRELYSLKILELSEWMCDWISQSRLASILQAISPRESHDFTAGFQGSATDMAEQ